MLSGQAGDQRLRQRGKQAVAQETPLARGHYGGDAGAVHHPRRIEVGFRLDHVFEAGGLRIVGQLLRARPVKEALDRTGALDHKVFDDPGRHGGQFGTGPFQECAGRFQLGPCPTVARDESVREIGPRPAAARKVVANLHGLQFLLGDRLTVEQKHPFHELVAVHPSALAEAEVGALVEFVPAAAGRQTQLEANHRDVQALAGLAQDGVFGLGS